MQWINDIRNAVSIRKITVAVVVLLAGQVGLYHLIVQPSKERKQVLKRKLDRVQETYLQLQSTDMNSLIDRLKAEVKYTGNKRDKILASPMAREQIPFLISKLEREAETAGLRVASNLGRNENEKSVQSALIALTFSGSFNKVMRFLSRLENWEDAVLLRDFSIESKSFESGELRGQMNFVSLIASN
jgi:Tfp pilus assembly protein PilO